MRKIIYTLSLILGIGSFLSSCQELTDPNELIGNTEVVPNLHIDSLTYTGWGGSRSDLDATMYPIGMNFWQSDYVQTFEVKLDKDWELPKDIVTTPYVSCAAYAPETTEIKHDGLGIIHVDCSDGYSGGDILCGSASIGDDGGIKLNLQHVAAMLELDLECSATGIDDLISVDAFILETNSGSNFLPTQFDYSLDGKIINAEYASNIILKAGWEGYAGQGFGGSYILPPATAEGDVKIIAIINGKEYASGFHVSPENLYGGAILRAYAIYDGRSLKISDVKVEGWKNNPSGDIDIED